MSVSASRPLTTFGFCWKRSRAAAVGASWALSAGEARSTGIPTRERRCEDRRGVGQRPGGGLQVGEEGRRVAQERTDPRQVLDRRVLGRDAPRDRLLDERSRHRGEGAEGLIERDEHLGLGLGDRGDLGRRACSRPRKKPARSVCGELRLRITGISRSTSGRQVADRRVERQAAAGEGVAELELVQLDSRRVGSWKVLKSWSISTGSGRAGVEPGASRPAGSPSSDCPGSISRNFSPSAERERTMKVDPRAAARRSCRASGRAWRGPCRPLLDRGDRLTVPTRTPPTRTSLPWTSALAFGTLGRDLVGRHEGQAVVGVVGEEDGEDHDQRRQRPDQDRDCREPLDGRLLMGPGGSRGRRISPRWRWAARVTGLRCRPRPSLIGSGPGGDPRSVEPSRSPPPGLSGSRERRAAGR